MGRGGNDMKERNRGRRRQKQKREGRAEKWEGGEGR